MAREAAAAKRPLSIGLLGNAAEVLPRMVERGSSPTWSPTRPARTTSWAATCRRACRTRRRSPCARGTRSGTSALSLESMARHCRAILAHEGARGASPSTTATTCGRRRCGRGWRTPSTTPASCPPTSDPCSARGEGPFRWVALSGDPADIAATDEALARGFPREEAHGPVARAGRRAGEAHGAARPDLLAGLRRARQGGQDLQRPGANRAR